MRKYLLVILFLLIPIAAYSWMGTIMVGGGTQAAGASPEDAQSFETGSDGTFDSGMGAWTVPVDTDGVINTSDNTDPHCGTYSLSIVADSDSSVENYVQVDIGSSDTDYTIRFYGYVPMIPNGARTYTFYLDDDTGAPGTSTRGNLRFDETDSGNCTVHMNTSGDSGDITLAMAAWYRFEIDWLESGTSALRVYNLAGTIQGSEQSFTPYTNGAQYLKFRDYSSSATATTWYYDDVKFDLNGGAIGAQTCQVGP